MRNVNFAPRRWPRWIGWLILIAGVSAVWMSHRAAVRWASALEETDRARRMAAQAQSARSNASRKTEIEQQAEAARFKWLQQRVGIAWQPLFSAIEAAPPAGVSLLAVEPDPQSGSVRLQAQARSLELIPSYLTHLGAQAGWSTVQLVSHRLMDTALPQGPVRFVVTARWNTAHE